MTDRDSVPSFLIAVIARDLASRAFYSAASHDERCAARMLYIYANDELDKACMAELVAGNKYFYGTGHTEDVNITSYGQPWARTSAGPGNGRR